MKEDKTNDITQQKENKTNMRRKGSQRICATDEKQIRVNNERQKVEIRRITQLKRKVRKQGCWY